VAICVHGDGSRLEQHLPHTMHLARIKADQIPSVEIMMTEIEPELHLQNQGA
jgi:hypothetical protein